MKFPSPLWYSHLALPGQWSVVAFRGPGTPCSGPKVCHRLDFRVAGPLLVATSLEAARRIKRLFAEQRVEKVAR